MAGDWIKMECCTPEKAEVLAITAKLGWDDVDITVGKLFRMWRWFDQQTENGNARSVTAALLDRMIGVTGFCEAVQSVGWIEITEAGINLPNFDRHNGTTAKSRALGAKRTARSKGKAKGNGDGDDKGNGHTVTETSPREEKRREDPVTTVTEEKAPRVRSPSIAKPDGVTEQTWSDWLQLRKSKKAPVTETVLAGAQAEAGKANLTLEQFLQVWCTRGSQGLQADWLKPSERGRPASTSSHSGFAGIDYNKGINEDGTFD